jgi:hypothetical protein
MRHRTPRAEELSNTGDRNMGPMTPMSPMPDVGRGGCPTVYVPEGTQVGAVSIQIRPDMNFSQFPESVLTLLESRPQRAAV